MSDTTRKQGRMSENKVIRPIVAYKKANPELYDYYNAGTAMLKLKGGSKKQEENNFYFVYSFLNSGIETRTEKGPNPFIFTNDKQFNNITTLTELGRLTLYGWYYGIEDFTKEICGYINNVYNNTLEKDRAMMAGLMTGAASHIRENLGYYYKNQDSMKIYLMQELAKEELDKIAPDKPDLLVIVDAAIRETHETEAENLRKNKRHYIKLSYNQAAYIDYLQGLLDEYGIRYRSFEGNQEKEEEALKPFYEKIEALESEHRTKTITAARENNKLT